MFCFGSRLFAYLADGLKEHAFAINAPAARHKKVADFHREVALVFPGIDLEQDFAAGLETLSQVVQEKFPFIRVPATRLVFAAIKGGRKSGDQIELAPEIRQRLKRPYLPGHALQAEELNQLVRKRKVANIETEAFVTELLGQKQKKTGPASKIENLFWR